MQIVELVNEFVETYNRNIDIINLALPSELVKELEEFLSRLILKYVFLANKAEKDEIAMIKISKELLEALLRAVNYC